MKNLLLLFFTLITISLFGQLEYSASLGPNLNFQEHNFGNKFAPFSSYANFGVKYPLNFIKLTGEVEWSISNWYIDDVAEDFFFTEFYLQTDYIKINPGIEVDLGKYFCLNTEVYIGARMNEVLKENLFFFGGFPPTSDFESNATRLFDVGIQYGGKINFSKKVALTINFIRGSRSILKKSFSNPGGSTTRNEVLKNRNIQVGVEFNLSEY